MAKKIKLGRPSTVDWSKVGLMWKHRTDSQIAEALGTSYVNVFLHRRNRIAKAAIAGEPTENFICTLPKWTRRKKTVVPETEDAQSAQETAENVALNS